MFFFLYENLSGPIFMLHLWKMWVFDYKEVLFRIVLKIKIIKTIIFKMFKKIKWKENLMCWMPDRIHLSRSTKRSHNTIFFLKMFKCIVNAKSMHCISKLKIMLLKKLLGHDIFGWTYAVIREIPNITRKKLDFHSFIFPTLVHFFIQFDIHISINMIKWKTIFKFTDVNRMAEVNRFYNLWVFFRLLHKRQIWSRDFYCIHFFETK